MHPQFLPVELRSKPEKNRLNSVKYLISNSDYISEYGDKEHIYNITSVLSYVLLV